MEAKDLTAENLKILIDMSCSINSFRPEYLTFEKVTQGTPEETFLSILWYSNFELWEINEFKDLALEFIYEKDLKEMPKHINDHNDILSSDSSPYYNWISLVAKWRLAIGC
jgi:hypothetical protein